MTTSIGKTLRLGRLFDADSNTSMILPMDHGVEEPVYGELERPTALIASLARAGVNAFLMRRGLAAFAAETIAGRAGWVQRLTGRTGLSPGLETEQLVFASVEEALRNGADAVVPTFFLGPDTEAVQLPKLGAIADECSRLGIPLLAEIFPVGGPDAVPYDGPYTVDDMRVAVRVASEEGADFIKTWYTGDPESFRRVIDYSLVPVLIAGGPKARNERDVLEMVRGAMDAGACGIAMGRKIWQSRDPAAMVRALAAIIRHGAGVDEAAGLLAPAPAAAGWPGSRSPAYDVVVIGGGVLGTAVAARLAMTTASVCLLEEADDVAEGASKGNAGIATSFYAPPGTLEADLIASSWPRWEDICDRLDVPFSRPGALTVAITDEQVLQLEPICADAIAAGTRAELLTAGQARELEPLLTPECRGAVHLPDEGLIDPVRLTCGYADLAAANGAAVRLSCPALGFEVADGLVTAVHTPDGTVRARWVINAAGLAGGTISALAGGEEIRIWPRKGQYWVLDRAFGEQLSKMVLPVPMPHSRGVQVVPTTNGSALLGPDAQEITDPADKGTDPASLRAILQLTERLVPGVSLDYAIKTYAANRAACDETVRVRPDARRPNLFHVGNRSTGVSASPGTADRVLDLLRESGLDREDRPDPVRRLRKVRRLRHDPDPGSLPDADPRYRQVVCVCEQVTAAEIAAAFDRQVPPRSVEGIRKRTQATGGRCQGSVCMVGVAFLCSLHTGVPPAAIRQGPAGATLGVGSEP